MLTNVLEGLTMFAYKKGNYLRAKWEGWREWERECVQESGEKERAAMAAAIAAAVRAPKWAGSWVILLHVFVVILSLYISNNMDSPVDVDGFAEPRKTLSQCALPSVEQLSVHPRFAHGGAGIPNNWYQSTWFKGVFDFAQK